MSSGGLSPIPEPLEDDQGPSGDAGEGLGDEDETVSDPGTPSRSYVDGLSPERRLEDGASVIFFTGRGQLITARKSGRFWDMSPITVGQTTYDADGNQRLQFYPPEAIFVVMRRGRHVGFRSLAAEGKTLQATGREPSPHRINNYNFGDWESWEQTSEGLMNVKWKAMLGYEIREVRSVAVEDLKGAHRSHLRSVRQMQAKVQNAELKISESERRVKEVLRSNQRQQALHQKEASQLRSRLDEALKVQQKTNVESLQTGAAYKEVELRLNRLTSEKDALESAAGSADQRYQSIQREMELIRERHDAEVHRLELAHSSEMSALIKEKDLELKQAKQHYEEQHRKLKEISSTTTKTREIQIHELEGRLDGTLKEKDKQIAQLLGECRRLHTAMRAIKTQLENAHIAKASIEAGSLSLSPVGSPTMSLRTASPLVGSRSGSRQEPRSRSPARRSGRMSADPVLMMDVATTLIPGAATEHGRVQLLRSHGRQGSLDRSGARAPTPSNDALTAKARSPTSSHDDANPPPDETVEDYQLRGEPSLVDGVPRTADDIVMKRIRSTARQDSSFTLRSGGHPMTDGDESDSFESAIDDEEGVDQTLRKWNSQDSAKVLLKDKAASKPAKGAATAKRAGSVGKKAGRQPFR